MQDSFGNIRYYGANPNNYVTFNNEESGWRIIGVFDTEDENGNIEKRVKLVRTTSIGNYAITGAPSTTSSSMVTSNKRNIIPKLVAADRNCKYSLKEWPDSELNYELNYYYFNATTGSCFVSENVGFSSCDFSLNGLNNESRSMVDRVKFSVGTEESYPNSMYKSEKSASMFVTSIGVIYASDYGYSTDLGKCQSSFYYYDNTECKDNNWLYSIHGAATMSTGAATGNFSDHALKIYSDGKMTENGNSGEYLKCWSSSIYPVLYLNSNIQIVNGTGTQSEPYILSL